MVIALLQPGVVAAQCGALAVDELSVFRSGRIAAGFAARTGERRQGALMRPWLRFISVRGVRLKAVC